MSLPVALADSDNTDPWVAQSWESVRLASTEIISGVGVSVGRIFPSVLRFIKEAGSQIASFTLKVRLGDERLSHLQVVY